MIEVGFSADAEDILRGLVDMEKAMESFRLPLQKGALILAASTEQGFRQGGHPEPWEPLKRTSGVRLAPTPLMKTGALMRAATDTTGGEAYSAYELKDDAVVIGVKGDKPGAVYQQTGTRTIPAREYLFIRDGDVDKIVDEFVVWANALTARCFG